jgi:hypothetical protein
MSASLLYAAAPARADATCTASANPSTHGGLQALLNTVGTSGSPDPVACIPSGTYTADPSLIIPSAMTVLGTGATKPVITCGGNVCFDASNGPSGVTLQYLTLSGGHKGGVQVGKSGGATVSGWTMTDLNVTGAGQVGIAMNSAADITISNSTIDRNGTIAYNASSNPTGDFGLRANHVDGLTLQNSTISNNPATSGLNTSFAAGAKFSTTTDLLVQNNIFTGNAGGAQIWLDISASDSHIMNNTIGGGPGATSGAVANAGIRVEVSCAGQGGSEVSGNALTGGTVAGIDVFDSSGISIDHNTVTVPQDAGVIYGIRMYGNAHGAVPDPACQQGGSFPNRDNVATANTIDVSQAPKALNGVKNVSGGISDGNAWTGNVYTAKHCDGPASANQWTWWDGSANNVVGYSGWRAFGQDATASSTCTALLPELDMTTPLSPAWGPAGAAVTIRGRGFLHVTSVKFNGVAASFTHTDTSIATTVPASASTGPVCVSDGSNSACTAASFQVGPTNTLAVTLAGNGTGTVTSQDPYPGVACGATCQAAFPQGASVVLHAQAAGNATFEGWSGDCSGTGACTVGMSAARNVTATFQRVNSVVTVTMSGSGSGSVTSTPGGIACPGTCSQGFNQGDDVTLTAQPAPGSRFAGWTGDCTNDPCDLTIDSDKNVTATFELTRHLAVATDGGGTGTVSSDVGGIDCPTTVCTADFDHNTLVTLTAHPDPGSAIAAWDYPGCGSGPTCAVTMDTNQSVTATFASSVTLAVTLDGEGLGTVISTPHHEIDCPSACSSSIALNRSITLHASADASSIFTGWSGGGCSGTTDCTVTMDADQTVTATFTPAWVLTVERTGVGAGTVTSDVGGITCGGICQSSYLDGTPVTLHAVDGANATFASWSGDTDGGCSSTADCTVTMDQARTVVANYDPVMWPLSVTKTGGTGGGTITSLSPNAGIDCGATCSQSFQQGTSVVLHAAPDGASAFSGWNGGGCSGTANCTVAISAAKTVNAQFDPAQRSLIVTKAGSGTGSITSNVGGINCPGTCGANFVHGTVVQLSATPSGGSTFAGWSGGSCSGTATPCTITMDTARSVTASFDPPASVITVKDNDPGVAYNGWAGVSDLAANGGTYRSSDVKSDLASWKSPVTNSITLVVHEGPSGGKASVTIDGNSKGTLDLYAASSTFTNVVYSLPKKTHTIVLKVLHTKSAASAGYAVGLDAFIVGTTTTQDSEREITYDTWDGATQALATNGTYRWAADAKALVTVSFTGTAIDWVTAKGKGYGKASVKIDGVSQGTVDLYKSTTVWQSLISYSGLGAGPHTLTVQPLALKNPAATGKVVVVDGFIVHP